MLGIENSDVRLVTEGAVQLGLAICVQALQDYELLVKKRKKTFRVYGVTYYKEDIINFIESDLFTLWSSSLDGKQCIKMIDKRCKDE